MKAIRILIRNNLKVFIVACSIMLLTIFLRHSQLGKPYQSEYNKFADVRGRGESLAGHFVIPTNTSSFNHVPILEAQQMFFRQCTTRVAPPCSALRRFGRKGDGGYELCLSGAYNLTPTNCLIYSFGIGRMWDFDDELQHYGCEVHSFDPSIGLTSHTRAANHHFHNVGIWNKDIVNDAGWQLRTLTSIMEKLGHTNRVIDVLKIDVEGAEWPVLSHWLTTNVLANIKQLIFEIHTPVFKGEELMVQHYTSMYNSLGELRETWGFNLYLEHHTNGCCFRFAVLTPAKIANTHRNVCCYELYFININYNRKTT